MFFFFGWALGISWYYREECRSGETSRYSFLQSNFVFFHMIHSTTFLLFWNNKKKLSFLSFIVPQESVHYFHFGPPETLFPEKQTQKLRKSADIVLEKNTRRLLNFSEIMIRLKNVAYKRCFYFIMSVVLLSNRHTIKLWSVWLNSKIVLLPIHPSQQIPQVPLTYHIYYIGHPSRANSTGSYCLYFKS